MVSVFVTPELLSTVTPIHSWLPELISVGPIIPLEITAFNASSRLQPESDCASFTTTIAPDSGLGGVGIKNLSSLVVPRLLG